MINLEPKIMEHVKDVLLQFDNLYIENNHLKRNKVIEDLDHYDTKLINALLSDDLIKKTYTEKIFDIEIFKINQFIEMFEYKEFWEDSYTKYKNKIGLTSNGKFIDESPDVILDFPFKDTILKAGMSKEDLDKNENVNEVFLNEVIAKAEIDELLEPKILVNAKKYDESGVHDIDKFNMDDNLILKGNNLIALHSIKERYAGKIKLIYLDPPYNTGSDSFVYNDRFNHSAWLTFMKNRFEIAKELLMKDGSIFVHCDNNEVKYLGILLDEIFGKNNFVELITIVNNPRGRDYGGIANMHEFIYVYRNSNETIFNPETDIDKIFQYEDNISGFDLRELRNRNIKFNDSNRPNLCYPIYVDPDSEDDNGLYNISIEKSDKFFIEIMPKKSQGIQTVWRWGKEKLLENININVKAKKSKDGTYSIQEKYRKNTKMVRSVWWDKNVNSEKGTLHIKELFNNKVFSFPKPEGTLKKIIELGSNEEDFILDFFMGSGTTQAVAMKMNRKFIGIEQMDYINDVSVLRLQKVIDGEQGGISKEVNWQGGGSFIYAELMEKDTGYLKEIINATTEQELTDIFSRIKKLGDFDFRVDLEKFEQDRQENNLSFEESRDLLFKMIDKNQLYYNKSNIDDEDIKSLISDTDYKFNKSFYEG